MGTRNKLHYITPTLLNNCNNYMILANEVVKDRLLLTYTPALQSTLNF